MATYTASEKRAYAKGCAKGEANMVARAEAAEAEAEGYANKAGERGRQVTDLQVANNHYLERARKAEGICNDLRNQLDTANDLVEDLRTEVEATTNAALVEQTWLRMELAKNYKTIDWWTNHATDWAKAYGSLQQAVEKYESDVRVWIKGMQGYGKLGLLIDMLLAAMWFTAFTGLTAPVLDWNWPWQ